MTESDRARLERPVTDRLLNERTAGGYLARRGLISSPVVRAVRLAGGVSNIVLAVRHGDREFLVKQSLARLAVDDEWLAPTDRIITEAEAMVTLAGITPDHVPRVYDQDAEHHTIVLQLAPPGWSDWKSALMAGRVDKSVAGALGGILGTWHRRTLHADDLGTRLESFEAFELLRIDPYYRTVGMRLPRVANAMEELIRRMAATRVCLVHGDFSPKNILVAPDHGTRLETGQAPLSPWVIDFEVAHRGDPAFDIAFMCTHLLLKSLAMPASGPSLDACLREFITQYNTEAAASKPNHPTSLRMDWTYICQHIGALLLARVMGKSPVEYLTAKAKRAALNLGVKLLEAPVPSIDSMFERRDQAR